MIVRVKVCKCVCVCVCVMDDRYESDNSVESIDPSKHDWRWLDTGAHSRAATEAEMAQALRWLNRNVNDSSIAPFATNDMAMIEPLPIND